MTSSAPIKQDTLIGLAFPVVRVRFAGPTNSHGSRYIAELRGERVTVPYDYALSASANAYEAAVMCWNKYRAQHSEAYDGDEQERVFVPGDLSDDSYAFTIVPAGFLS